MLHPQMRVRLTTQVLLPWAVQYTTGTVMEIDLSARDKQRIKNNEELHLAPEMVLEESPESLPRLPAGVQRCPGALWVVESKHFQTFRHCLSGHRLSRVHLPPFNGVPELSGCWNLSISKHLGTV